MAEGVLDVVKKTYNFTIERETTFGSGNMLILDSDGAAVNISAGYVATMGIRSDIDEDAVLTESDVTFTYGNGTLSFIMLKAVTGGVDLVAGNYIYDILLTKSADDSCALCASGSIRVKEICARADA